MTAELLGDIGLALFIGVSILLVAAFVMVLIEDLRGRS